MGSFFLTNEPFAITAIYFSVKEKLLNTLKILNILDTEAPLLYTNSKFKILDSLLSIDTLFSNSITGFKIPSIFVHFAIDFFCRSIISSENVFISSKKELY